MKIPEYDFFKTPNKNKFDKIFNQFALSKVPFYTFLKTINEKRDCQLSFKYRVFPY